MIVVKRGKLSNSVFVLELVVTHVAQRSAIQRHATEQSGALRACLGATPRSVGTWWLCLR